MAIRRTTHVLKNTKLNNVNNKNDFGIKFTNKNKKIEVDSFEENSEEVNSEEINFYTTQIENNNNLDLNESAEEEASMDNNISLAKNSKSSRRLEFSVNEDNKINIKFNKEKRKLVLNDKKDLEDGNFYIYYKFIKNEII